VICSRSHSQQVCFCFRTLLGLMTIFKFVVVKSYVSEHGAFSLSLELKVTWSCYRPRVAQRVGRGIALLFHYHGTRRGWVVSNTPRPHFTPRKDPVPILQEARWAPGSVWTGGKSHPHRNPIPDRPARSQPLHWLSYPAHTFIYIFYEISRQE